MDDEYPALAKRGKQRAVIDERNQILVHAHADAQHIDVPRGGDGVGAAFHVRLVESRQSLRADVAGYELVPAAGDAAGNWRPLVAQADETDLHGVSSAVVTTLSQPASSGKY